jgi:N-acetylglutamate synthase-like GNAT family acetyltransferase
MLNMEDLIIRVFRPEDIEDVYNLVIDTINKSYSRVYSKEAIISFKEYHCKDNILNDSINGYTIIIEFEGRIIGTGTLLNTNIRRVFVDKQFQHQGLGKIIMKCLEEKAFEQGIKTVELSASLVARKFYNGLGYITQTYKSFDVTNNKKLFYYEMIKPLN